MIIVDDPLNANEAQSETARKRVIDWYGGSLVSRLNDKERGAIVAVMQRLHEDDLAGHLLQQGGWSTSILPPLRRRTRLLHSARADGISANVATFFTRGARTRRRWRKMGEKSVPFSFCPVPATANSDRRQSDPAILVPYL